MSIQMASEATRSVRNVEQFQEEFRRYANAAVGIIMIRTREPQRCYNALQIVAIQKKMQFRLWTCNHGWQGFPPVCPGDDVSDIHRPLDNGDLQTIDAAKALDHINRISQETTGSIYVMYYPHHHFDKPIIQQYLKDFAAKSREEEVRLVMLVPDTAKLPIEIEDDIYIMDFLPPSHSELETCYRGFVESLNDEVRPDFSDEGVTAIIQNGLGMTYGEFETAIALAVVTFQGKRNKNEEVTAEDYVKLILSHKTEIIKKTDLLELMPAEDMGNVGGFDMMKAWLKLRSKAFSEEARAYGIKVPRGILCVGPPGSGKSLFAKATANTFMVPLVKFDIAKVFGRYIGESESRIRSGIKVIEALAPCVLLMDEIDKGFGGVNGGGGDGGVLMRVLGSFLNWLQDRDIDRYPVFVVMTANNVIGLPPELMRRGRIDEIFACTFPGHDERKEILAIHLGKRGHNISRAGLDKVAAACDKYVGSELESAIENALLESFEQGLDGPTPEIIIKQLGMIVPLSKAFADKINVMHEWAKNNARPASSSMTFEQSPITAKPPIRKVQIPSRGPVRGTKNLDG